MRNDHTIIEGYYFGDDEQALKESMVADQLNIEETENQEVEVKKEKKEELRIVSRKKANKVPNPPRFHMLKGDK